MQPPFYEFGPYRLNPISQKLWRAGRELHLTDTEFRVLVTIICARIPERGSWPQPAKHAVSKDALLASVWPNRPYLDESNLTTHIRNLRKKLDNSPTGHSYIGNSTHVGYFMTVPIELVSKESSDIQADEVASNSSNATDIGDRDSHKSCPEVGAIEPNRKRISLISRKRWPLIGSILFAATSAIAFGIADLWPREARVVQNRQLTNDGRSKLGPVLTDSHRLFFKEARDGAYRIVAIPAAGGEPQPLENIQADMDLEDISRDGHSLLLLSDSSKPNLWQYSLVDHSLKLIKNGVYAATWEPAGDGITLALDGYIASFNLKRHTETKLFELQGRANYLRWAPDGRRLRLWLTDRSGLWEFNRVGNVARRLLQFSNIGEWTTYGTWTHNGEYFLYETGNYPSQGLWGLKEAGFSIHTPRPFQVTSGPASWSWPATSSQDSNLFAVHVEHRSELVRFDPNRKIWVPAWDDSPAY